MIEHAYIHIPFCTGKCHYCSFVSGKNIEDKDKYLKALIKQIKLEYKGEKLKTLYFGGGTPSLLEAIDIEQLISLFVLDDNAEVTIEVNPETVEYEKFLAFKKVGINRISLGVQTFDDEILKQIGRRHSSKIIYQAIENIKKAGFENISIDLMYGLPNQSIQMFENDVEKAVLLDIQHISTYGLKIEEASYFGEKKPLNIADDEFQAEMFTMLCKKLEENEFEHYEISNFSKPNFQSNHNNSYWKNKEYYGFGLNASGYIGNVRYQNEDDFDSYLLNPNEKVESTELTVSETMENEIFLGLRLRSGIEISKINKKYDIDFLDRYKLVIKKFEKMGLLEVRKDVCCLTHAGILLSNEVMCEFLEIC